MAAGDSIVVEHGEDFPVPRQPLATIDYISLAGELLRRLSRQDLLEPLDELSTELVPAGAQG